jgi:(1->4)-alpha-D-glucan 1-alpha-D-glucosylmutase
MAALRIPSATYRLQFNRNFRFADARLLVPYLHDLGITDLYASPILKARPGSAHGYDITDPTRLNPELGSEKDFEEFAAELKRHDMGLLLDIVPNHMAASVDNPWWADVLENGRSSPYARYFDIDWDAHPRGKIVLPVLASPLDALLEDGGLKLALDEDGFTLRYGYTYFPLDPNSYHAILSHRPNFPEAIGRLVDSLQRLPPPTVTPARKVAERRQAAERVKRDLWRLYETHPEVKQFVDESIRAFNAPGAALLPELLREQHYELAYWRDGVRRLNYRRFFDINSLVGARVEDPAVFQATHDLVVRLVDEGKVTGLRVDHIDGLRDPLVYLQGLQEAVSRKASPFYLLTEKILLGDEMLPEEWPTSGTTGYEFANLVNALFVDPQGHQALGATYRRFTGSRVSFSDVVYEQKKKVMKELSWKCPPVWQSTGPTRGPWRWPAVTGHTLRLRWRRLAGGTLR